MKELITFLSGKKTYIIAFLAAAYSICVKKGWLPNDSLVWELLGACGLTTLRLAMGTTQASVTKVAEVVGAPVPPADKPGAVIQPEGASAAKP